MAQCMFTTHLRTGVISMNYGYVFCGPDGEWHWSLAPDKHESVLELREATPVEASLAKSYNKVPESLWPYLQHRSYCALTDAHWMQASTKDCDCGFSEALEQL